MLPYAGRMPRGHQRGGLVASDARVAVVGLGAGGIAAVLGLRNAGFSNLTVFEAAACAGGTWAYSPNAHSAHSSMYESLRCNIPKESMCFVGRPLHAGADSFVGHRNVASYLQRIAAEENILPVVRFNSPVARVEPVDPQGFLTGWAVQTWVGAGADATAEGGARAVSDVEHFDAVVVCNGHFTDFPGTISHSHVYRTPDRFAGKRVVVLGAGPSGIDIALELHGVGADVVLSHNAGAGAGKHGGLVPQAAPVLSCRPDGSVLLADGATIDAVDELLLCTGYAYSMPFLSGGSGLTISEDGRAVHGLLMHCVSTAHPTLSVIGLPYKVVPFPLFQDQACFIGSVLRGSVSFAVTPEKLCQMAADERAERARRAVPEKYIHCLGADQWEYRRRLAGWSGGQAPTESVREIYDDSGAARRASPLTYRSRVYVRLGDGPGEWRVTVVDKKRGSAEPHPFGSALAP